MSRGQGKSADELRAIAKRMRRDIIEMLAISGSGHPGGSLSAIDLLTALWFNEMRHKVDDPQWEGRDRFILSKGHGVPALYCVLAEAGYIPHDSLGTLRQLGSPLQGHPDRRFMDCLEGNFGSLGQGISFGLGVGLGLTKQGSDARAYVMIGDGETDEGQIWEAALWAGAHPAAATNVCVITDVNRIQNDTFCDDLLPLEPLAAKWESMGWNVIDIDGHDMDAILGALEGARACTDKPTMILARTVKGKGVSFMEDVPKYHGVAPSGDEREKAL
ncbi:MAG: transketolase, partial [Planctomycetota bacterium]